MRSARGSTNRACAGSRTRGGRSAAATTPTVTATRYRAFTSPGARARAWWRPFERRVREAVARGLVELRFRHRVDELTVTGGAVSGVSGKLLEPSSSRRGEQSSRVEVGRLRAERPGGDRHHRRHRRESRPRAREVAERLGEPPARMLSGVPAHVDGRMLAIARSAGAREINGDRMWHYVEGVNNWSPIWPMHAIRIIPGPSSMWFDARGRRLPGPLWPGYDTLGTLAHIQTTGHDYTWFVLTQKIIEKEFALSGSEQNPDTTRRAGARCSGNGWPAGRRAPCKAFMDHGKDFVVERSLADLVRGMNALTGDEPDRRGRRSRLRSWPATARSANPYAKDGQVTAIHGARRYWADRLTRVAGAAPDPRPRRRAADRGTAVHPHAEVARRPRDRPRGARAPALRAAARRPLCGGRGGRLRRRRHARLPGARGHVPRRLPVLRPYRGTRGRRGSELTGGLARHPGAAPGLPGRDHGRARAVAHACRLPPGARGARRESRSGW